MSENINNSTIAVLVGSGIAVISYFLGRRRNEKTQKIYEIQKNTKNEINEIKESLQKEMSERLSLYDSRLSVLETKVCGMASHEKRISNLGVRVSEMQNHGERIFQLECNDKNKRESIINMEDQIGKLENTIDKVNVVEKKVDELMVEKPAYTFFSEEKGFIGESKN